jgi:hypothetical protein
MIVTGVVLISRGLASDRQVARFCGIETAYSCRYVGVLLDLATRKQLRNLPFALARECPSYRKAEAQRKVPGAGKSFEYIDLHKIAAGAASGMRNA